MDDLNPEILDAVMDVTEAQEDGDEITGGLLGYPEGIA